MTSRWLLPECPDKTYLEFHSSLWILSLLHSYWFEIWQWKLWFISILTGDTWHLSVSSHHVLSDDKTLCEFWDALCIACVLQSHLFQFLWSVVQTQNCQELSMGLAVLPGIVTEEIVMTWIGKGAAASMGLRKAAKDGWDWFKFSELCFQVNATWRTQPILFLVPSVFHIHLKLMT